MRDQTNLQIGADAAIDLLGGEMLTGSGFETETPDSDFAEAGASIESVGQ